MSFLQRHLAPLAPSDWEVIEAESRRALELQLAARRLVELHGPKGWTHGAVSTGRVQELPADLHEGVRVVQRQVQPLVELWAPFELSRRELEDLSRGAADVDTTPLVEAAAAIALAEDRAVFHGYPAGGIRGMIPSSPHGPLTITEQYGGYPSVVIEALELLREGGVPGPYAIALGRRCYTGLLKATDPGGYPMLNRLRNLLDGPIVRAPAVDGAVVLSTEPGAFELTVGQDLSVGYTAHEAERVRLFLVESLTFRVLQPEAAVPLAYRS